VPQVAGLELNTGGARRGGFAGSEWIWRWYKNVTVYDLKLL